MRGPNAPELLRALREARPIGLAGERWHYSNLGYALLGLAVTGATGRDCFELIDESLMGPLGLARTTWTPLKAAAVGYGKDAYSDALLTEPIMDQGAVGVGGQAWSTVRDLLVWGDALCGGAPAVVPAEVVEWMHTLQVLSESMSWASGWGLGLGLTRRDGRAVAGHTGAMPGFAAALSLHRASRTVAVVLANVTRGADVAGLCATILDHGRPNDDAVPVGPAWAPGPAAPPQLAGLLGRWWCEFEETIFTWRAGVLSAHLAEGGPGTRSEFEPTEIDEFRVVNGRLRGEILRVNRDPGGVVESLTWATYPYTREPRASGPY